MFILPSIIKGNTAIQLGLSISIPECRHPNSRYAVVNKMQVIINKNLLYPNRSTQEPINGEKKAEMRYGIIINLPERTELNLNFS